jgi:hypothetical protein
MFENLKRTKVTLLHIRRKYVKRMYVKNVCLFIKEHVLMSMYPSLTGSTAELSKFQAVSAELENKNELYSQLSTHCNQGTS